MMSEPCGGILTHNGDSYRVSSRRGDLAGTHLLSSRNDSSQISQADTKEALRTDGNIIAWQAWDTARNIIWQSCQPGPPLVFPGEMEIFRAMYAQVGASIYSHSAGCIYEGTEEEKAG